MTRKVRDTELTGVILAAGRGTRMKPFSTRYPKPILPICNKPLLHYQIEMMKGVGIDKIIIVIGHLGYEIAQKLGSGNHLGVDITFVEQRETLGIAHAVGKLEPYISSPILLSLGDIFFVTEDLKIMMQTMEDSNASAVLAVKHEENIEAIKRNFTVLHDENNRVKRVIEKPRHITTNIKGCGLYLFNQYVFDAIRRTPKTAMRDEYEITDTIQIIIDDGFPVLFSEVVKWDMNVTFPTDILECNLMQIKRLGKENIIGNQVEIHAGAKIKNSVIGDGAVIQHPIEIKDTVIFADSIVTTDHNIDSFVLTPEHQIDCKNFIL
jgi:dTDP-glucose pyrophosphorylase